MVFGSRWSVTLARVKPHVVAAFVVVHVVACLLAALPNPAVALDRRHWKEPRVQAELAAWSKRLGVAPDLLEERMWSLTTAWIDVRKLVLSPVRPYLDASGMRQHWAMFAAGTRHRDRFQLRGRSCATPGTGCTWRALYTTGVEDEDFLRAHIEHPRVRSGSFRWIWPDHRARYRRACTALARRAFAAFPDLERVQCRFERSLSPAPRREATPTSPPTWHQEFDVTRAMADAGAQP